MRRTISSSLILRVFSAVIILCCIQSNAMTTSDGVTELYTLWLFPGFYSEFGASYALDRQRASTESYLYDRGVLMHSKVVENVTESGCVELAKQLLSAGFNSSHPFDAWVISYPPHISCADTIASDPEFSHIYQFVMGEAAPLPTRSIVSLSVYEARFLHGVMCAMEAENLDSNTVGMVVPSLEWPDYIRSLHGFAAGVRMRSDSINIQVALAESLYGEVGYRKAAEGLIQRGVSCLATSVPTLSPNHAAAAHGVSSTALHPFTRELVGETVIINVAVQWEHAVSKNLLSLSRNETFPKLDETSVANGTIVIVDIATKVRSNARSYLSEVKQNMTDGRLAVFCTPQFNDYTVLLQANASFELEPGVLCLTELGIELLDGLPRGSEVVVRYDADHSPWVYRYIEWDSLPSIVLIALVGSLVVLTLLGLASVILNRRATIYKSASPLFLGLILIGILLGCASSLISIGEPSQVTCLAPWWFEGLALSLIYSCVLAKNFRIWRIFSSQSLKLVNIVNLDLLAKFVISSFIFEISILITLTIYEPPIPIKDTGLSYLKYDEVQIMCRPPQTTTNSRFFLLTIILYHFALLVAGAFISFKTRNAKLWYRESEDLAIVIVISMILQIVIALISFAFPKNYKVSFYMNAYGTWALMATAYGGLFLPKFWGFHVRGYTATPPSAITTALTGDPRNHSTDLHLSSDVPSSSMIAPEMQDQAEANPLGSSVDVSPSSPNQVHSSVEHPPPPPTANATPSTSS